MDKSPNLVDSKTATAPVLETPRPAGSGIIPELVTADGARHEERDSSHDARVEREFQALAAASAINFLRQPEVGPVRSLPEHKDMRFRKPHGGSLTSTGKAYPPTLHEAQWNEIEEWHAADIADAQAGMGQRTIHFFTQMRREAALAAESSAMLEYKAWEPLCESEIEKLFLMALVSHMAHSKTMLMPSPEMWRDDPYAFMTTKMVDYLGDEIPGRDPVLTGVLMQVPVHGYRADFVLYGISAGCDDKSTWLKFPLLVECDGHDFHDRTKEQAARDRKRDRTLASLGYATARFTGSELWRDPHTCLSDALSIIARHQNIHHHGAWIVGA